MLVKVSTEKMGTHEFYHYMKEGLYVPEDILVTLDTYVEFLISDTFEQVVIDLKSLPEFLYSIRERVTTIKSVDEHTLEVKLKEWDK